MTDHTIPCVGGPCDQMRTAGRPGQLVTSYHTIEVPFEGGLGTQNVQMLYRVSDDGTHADFVEGSIEPWTPPENLRT